MYIHSIETARKLESDLITHCMLVLAKKDSAVIQEKFQSYIAHSDAIISMISADNDQLLMKLQKKRKSSSSEKSPDRTLESNGLSS